MYFGIPVTETFMTPWILLDSAQVPGNGGELQLYQRGDEFSIKLAGAGELMNSRVHVLQLNVSKRTLPFI